MGKFQKNIYLPSIYYRVLALFCFISKGSTRYNNCSLKMFFFFTGIAFGKFFFEFFNFGTIVLYSLKIQEKFISAFQGRKMFFRLQLLSGITFGKKFKKNMGRTRY